MKRWQTFRTYTLFIALIILVGASLSLVLAVAAHSLVPRLAQAAPAADEPPCQPYCDVYLPSMLKGHVDTGAPPTPAPTRTITPTPTDTVNPTPSTPVPIESSSPTPTKGTPVSSTATPTATETPPTATPTATETPPTATPTVTGTPPTSTPTHTPAWTGTPTSTPTITPTPTPTGAVEVVSTTFYTRTLGSRTTAYVFGEVRNVSRGNLKDVRVRVRFLDREGAPVKELPLGGLYQNIIGPNQTSSFRLVDHDLPAQAVKHSVDIAGYTFTGELPLPPLQVTRTRVYTDQYGQVYVSGEVQNSAAANVTHVKVIITMYDSAGKVVFADDSGDGWRTPYGDILAPGGTSPFHKLLQPQPPAEYSSPRYQAVYDLSDEAPSALLSVLNMGDYQRGSAVYIYGEVLNNLTGTRATEIKVAGTLYEGGTVVNAWREWLTARSEFVLGPGQKAPFILPFDRGLVKHDLPPQIRATFKETDKPAPSSTEVVIVGSSVVRREDPPSNYWVEITGYFVNRGSRNVTDLRVIATFYGQQGQVVNAGWTSSPYHDILAPGQQLPFILQVDFFDGFNYAGQPALTVDYKPAQ